MINNYISIQFNSVINACHPVRFGSHAFNIPPGIVFPDRVRHSTAADFSADSTEGAVKGKNGEHE